MRSCSRIEVEFRHLAIQHRTARNKIRFFGFGRAVFRPMCVSGRVPIDEVRGKISLTVVLPCAPSILAGMTDNAADLASLGLRERKKLMTRQAILDVAEEMFAERGFDNVTVAEIADAVNISAKTVFVYFPAKEDLVFAGEHDIRDLVLAGIRDRGANQTPLEAMGAFLRDQISAPGAAPVVELDRLRRTVGDSAVLQARLRLMWEHFEVALAGLLAEETGQPATAPAPRVAAAQLILIFRLLASEEVLANVRSRPRNKQRAAMLSWLDESLRLVGGGLDDYARS